MAALAFVQLGSSAIFADTLSPTAPSAHLPRALGVAIYRVIERIAPAPYVEQMLARAAFDTGNIDEAERHALLLPPSPARNELLARYAQARGRTQLALEYYLVAPDATQVDAYVTRITKSDPDTAYTIESELLARLTALTTHPDAVASANWRLGRIATERGYQQPLKRAEAWRLGLNRYQQAAALAPLSEKYQLAVGNQLILLQDWQGARAAFLRALNINPDSIDARNGLAAVARRGAAT